MESPGLKKTRRNTYHTFLLKVKDCFFPKYWVAVMFSARPACFYSCLLNEPSMILCFMIINAHVISCTEQQWAIWTCKEKWDQIFESSDCQLSELQEPQGSNLRDPAQVNTLAMCHDRFLFLCLHHAGLLTASQWFISQYWRMWCYVLIFHLFLSLLNHLFKVG